MKPPEADIANRAEIWDAMQMLYMDTDPALEIAYIARVCAESSYTVDELALILFNEVLPACRFNLGYLVAPQWAGFEKKWLINRVLQTHRFNKRKPLWFRSYTKTWWSQLKAEIERLRAVN